MDRAGGSSLRIAVSAILWSLVLVCPGYGTPDNRLPILSKAQVLYSMVGHRMNIADRIYFYNTNGSPAGYLNYVVPYLVYEPSVTLYNPYDSDLDLATLRVRIVNPPVGFKFKKNDTYLRSEWASGGTFLGLGRFQIQNQDNLSVEKTFTLSLGGGDASSYAGPIHLKAGETKTFYPRVNPEWNWAWETSSGFSLKCFFDLLYGDNFTNADRRTSNAYGVECIASPDFHAGFHADHLATYNPRYYPSKYTFEMSRNDGWVAIKNSETITVEAKGMRTSGLAATDFGLELLRGENTNVELDRLRSYQFSTSNLIQPGNSNASTPAVSKTYVVQDIMQERTDMTAGGKKPFLVFTIAAKSNALKQGKFNSQTQPPASELYETRIDQITGFSESSSIGASDATGSGLTLASFGKSADVLTLNAFAPPHLGSRLKVKGTANLDQGFIDDLTNEAAVVEGPTNTGIYKVQVDVSNKGPRYWVRLENQ